MANVFNAGAIMTYFKGNNLSLNKSIASSQAKLGSFAKYAALAGAAIGATLFYKAFKAFKEFDEEMTKSMAIVKGVSQETRDELGKTARMLSTEFLFSSAELAKGYFFLISAGKNLAQSQILLRDVAQFAQAGRFDLATATSLLTDAQNALGLSSKDVLRDQQQMIRVSDVLVKANTLADATTQEFAEALTHDAAASMRAFNIELEEGVAVLATYADRGIKGASAGAMFGRFLRLLVPAAVKNEKVFKKLGIRVFNTSGGLRKTHQIVKDLTVAFSKMGVKARSAAMEQLGFMKRTQHVIFPLLGASEKMKAYEQATDKAGGTSERVADEQLDSLSAQFTLLSRNVVETTGKLTNMKGVVGSLKDGFKNMNKSIRKSGQGWIDTFRIMWVETKYVFLNVLALFNHVFGTNFFAIVSNLGGHLWKFLKWFVINWGKILDNGANIAMGFGDSVANAFVFATTSWFKIFTAFFRDVGVNFKNFAVAIKDAVMFRGWDFKITGKNLVEGMKLNAQQADEILGPLARAMNKAKLGDLPKFDITKGVQSIGVNFEDFNATLLKQEKARLKERKDIDAWYNKAIKDLNKPIFVAPKAGLPPDAKIFPDKYGKAILKGSLQDYQASLERGSTEDKIETNTAKTNKLMEKQITATNQVNNTLKYAALAGTTLEQGTI